MNFDIFEVIIIILSSGLATGLATAMFDTFIRSGREQKYRIEYEKIKAQHQLEIEKVKVIYQLEIEKQKIEFQKELEIFKVEHSQKLEGQRIEYDKEFEIFKHKLSQITGKQVYDVYKKLMELIYRIRNNFRETIKSWNVNSKVINEQQIQIDKLIDFIFENRFDLEQSGIFNLIHNFKNTLVSLPPLLNDLKYFLEINDEQKIQEMKHKILSTYEEIDTKYGTINEKLLSTEASLVIKN